jgi:hypothetical protein
MLHVGATGINQPTNQPTNQLYSRSELIMKLRILQKNTRRKAATAQDNTNI